MTITINFPPALRGAGRYALDALVKYPKAMAIVASWAVLAASYFGLHLTVAEVTAVAGALIPAVLGYHHAAIKTQLRRMPVAPVVPLARPPSV